MIEGQGNIVKLSLEATTAPLNLETIEAKILTRYKGGHDYQEWLTTAAEDQTRLIARIRELEAEVERREQTICEVIDQRNVLLDERVTRNNQLAAAREAVNAIKCSCWYREVWKCPKCDGPIVPVSGPAYLNSEQWDAVKAGDFICHTCEDPQTKTGRKYWFDRELRKELTRQCERCKALAALSGGATGEKGAE